MSSVYGVLCRLLWYSSLAWEARNTVIIEFSTPRNTAPNGILLCFTDSQWRPSAADVVVKSLQQGGDPWMPAHRELVASAASVDWTASAFFQAAEPRLFNPVEAVDPGSALGNDPYYDTSYTNCRYDDLVVDQTGSPLPEQLLQSCAATAAARPLNITSHSASSGGGGGSSAEHEQSASSTGQCLLISGLWQASMRYQLHLSFLNPPEPSAPLSVPVGLPGVWMAPLTYKVLINGTGQAAGVQLQVRGSKHGQLCNLRPQAAALLPQMFSACHAAAGRGLVASGITNTSACLLALQQELAANTTGLAGTFPFNVPPLAAGLSANSTPDATCPAGSVMSSQLGGECINCNNAFMEASSCRCFPGYTTNLVGPTACGARVSPTSNASSADVLAGQLCISYSTYYEKMMQGELSDRLVHSMYMNAFREQAAYLLDWTSIHEANASFWQLYARDDRIPSSPSRRTGIGPNCTACKNGMFKDIYTKQMVPVRDDRFLAVNTFRLFGYLLATAGYPCPQLWDPADPDKKLYGRYDKAMCMN